MILLIFRSNQGLLARMSLKALRMSLRRTLWALSTCSRMLMMLLLVIVPRRKWRNLKRWLNSKLKRRLKMLRTFKVLWWKRRCRQRKALLKCPVVRMMMKSRKMSSLRSNKEKKNFKSSKKNSRNKLKMPLQKK